MAKSALTLELEKHLWNHTKKRGTFACYEVTIGWYGKERIDYISYNTQGIWRCYEIKVLKSDFNSKAKVSFLGHFNYYVMPEELFRQVKDQVPPHIGVYIPQGDGLISAKNAKRQTLGVDEQILKNSMIRSLYRESERIIDSNDKTIVEKLSSKSATFERRYKNKNRQYNELCEKLRQTFGPDWEDVLE